MHVHGHTKTRMFWDTKTHVHRKPERTCIMGHKCLKRHRRTRSRVILSGREKEAGPRRGGERGPAYGPALGGEAGAVLIGSLYRKWPTARPQVSYQPPVAYHHRNRVAASANRITTYAAGPEKGLWRDRYRLVRTFFPGIPGGRSGRPSLRQARHCPQTRTVYDPTRLYVPKPSRSRVRDGGRRATS
jgi:hypothetical protein